MDKPDLQYNSAAITDKGLSEKRPVNEDSYLEMTERGFFVVADGVGGAQAGDFASQTAVEVLYEAFLHPPANVNVEELMEKAIERANASIHQMSRELPQLNMMATTVVALQITGNVATVGHVGDSRLYRLDPSGMLHRETNDHSVVEEEVRAGRMTLTQAANHPSRNVINRALGADDRVDVDIRTIKLEPGTKFLLCSDGVTRHLTDAELRGILTRNDLPIDACQEIKKVCYNRGAEDNLTAIVVHAENNAVSSVAAAAYDEENTITRPAFAPNPLPALTTNSATFAAAANDVPTMRSGQTLEHDIIEAPTAPLNTNLREKPPQRDFSDSPSAQSAVADDFSEKPETVLKPASQTIGLVENGNENFDAETALRSKIDNQRIREKIDSSAPFSNYREPAKSGSGAGKLVSSLLLLLIGALLGAALYYLLAGGPRQAIESANVQNEQIRQSLPTVSDLTAEEVNEFRTYERVRRTIDSKPNAEPAVSQPQTAVDYYLRGRALLQTGKYDESREALLQAERLLPQVEGVNQESLRVDIATAQAAVAAMTQAASTKRMLNELVKSKQQQTSPNLTTNP